jgi:hypothetical protein
MHEAYLGCSRRVPIRIFRWRFLYRWFRRHLARFLDRRYFRHGWFFIRLAGLFYRWLPGVVRRYFRRWAAGRKAVHPQNPNNRTCGFAATHGGLIIV